MDDLALIAPPPTRRLRRRARSAPDDLVLRAVTEHADSLLRVARRYTTCQADAEDAYQRALEILVRSAPRLDPDTVHKWLHTVVKHEAYAVRRQRAKLVGVEDDATLDALDDGRHVASVEERAERFEELTRAAEALKRLKPQEVTALVLKAQGLTYNEIAERQGWTYTKVNRCITEGRRSFLARYDGIASGAECERWAGVLSAMADGEATAEQLVEVRPHLRNCGGCRAVLAGMRDSGPALAGVLPPAVLGGAAAGNGGSPAGALWDRVQELLLGAQERVVAPVVKAHGALEAASASKVAAVAASAAAIAGGGVAVERGAGAGDARAAGAPVVRTTAVEASAPATAVATAPVTAPDPSGAAVAAQTAEREAEQREPERERPEFATQAPEPAPTEFAGEFDAPAAAAPGPEAPQPRPSFEAQAAPDPRPASGDMATEEFGIGG